MYKMPAIGPLSITAAEAHQTDAVDGDKQHSSPSSDTEKQQDSTQQANDDPNLVTWNGLNDPDDPKNWPFNSRLRVTALGAAFSFITPISTSMIAPALLTISHDLHIQQAFGMQLTLSSFILAYAFGPMLAAPLSEVCGRHVVMQTFNAFYLAFNIACGFAKTGPQLIVFRFFAGFGGSASAITAAGVISDVWRKEERTLAFSLFTTITFLSPSLGPVLGGFITQYSSWRWSFWTISIADAVIQVLGLLFFRETFPPYLLGSKMKALRAKSGNQELHTQWESSDTRLKTRLLQAFTRPLRLLFTQPLCQVISLYTLYLNGLNYLALASFAELWITQYHESISIAGLHYLALALGYVFGTQTCARLMNRIYKRLAQSRGDEGQPEYRLPLALVGVVLVPTGLSWYGWSAESKLLWIMPDIGIAIFGFGLRFTTQCVQVYGMDVYPTYIASAAAVGQFVRGIAGFTFPLFATYLYEDLGYGIGNTVLAVVAFVLGNASLAILWYWGPALRKKSPYAVG